ncbi:MAG: glycine cleavage system aminomethyltransferase GcvT [Thermoplasmata archaeon]|nr:MAG: glycine cleavage system aminomethyltransferase GcvT [Thermoplasmata archaeon]
MKMIFANLDYKNILNRLSISFPMKTALYELHKELGATFTNFMGYEMPLKYTSVQEEHLNVRHRVGIFDVGHMGNIFVRGKDAMKFISKITVENAEKITEGKGQYTLLLNYDGDILDDEVFLHLKNEYLFIPNSGMHKKIAEWMKENAEGDVEIEDVSSDYSILAVQGPLCLDVLREIISFDIASLPLFGCYEIKNEMKIDFEGRCIISRTGYTGERGYELYIHPAEEAVQLFKKILEAGKKYGIMPVGLGARDTLRLEKGFMLACNEFEGGRNPIEAGLEWCIDWEHEFIGKDALIEFKKKEDYEKITFLECIEAGIPRKGDIVAKNEEIGIVTSGNFSPCLKKGIALAYIKTSHRNIGDEVYIEGRRKIKARIVKGPFVKKGEC